MRGARTDAGRLRPSAGRPRTVSPHHRSMSASPALALACELIRRPSVTPEDAGCQTVLAERLAPLGFRSETMRFADVDNLWARRGTDGPLLVLLGHTDVVPPGPLEAWTSPPFEPTLRDGYLHGRGAADMKGSLAAMVTAVERFVDRHPAHGGSVALLVTSDEEGPSVNGVRRVVEALGQRGERIDWCLVGEPSSADRLGDTVRIGRRGSLNGAITARGIQGHIAYPHLARNPVHDLARLLAKLADTVWDEGSEHFPPTSFQVSNVAAGTGADNVIPGIAEAVFNFRYSTRHDRDSLVAGVDAACRALGLDCDIEWRHSGEPFLTGPGRLVEAVGDAVESVAGYRPELSTGGGTSDGRFVAPTGAEVVELGPVNATIHSIDERVLAADLDRLSEMYERVVARLLAA